MDLSLRRYYWLVGSPAAQERALVPALPSISPIDTSLCTIEVIRFEEQRVLFAAGKMKELVVVSKLRSMNKNSTWRNDSFDHTKAIGTPIIALIITIPMVFICIYLNHSMPLRNNHQ